MTVEVDPHLAQRSGANRSASLERLQKPQHRFVARGQIGRSLAPGLLGIFLLGALQGVLGWYMVKSGLVDAPRVSQYRLTAHPGMAFLIFAAMFRTALGMLAPAVAVAEPGGQRLRL